MRITEGDSSRSSMSQLREIDLPTRLLELKTLGWIQSSRRGDTGVGKTIEDYLGIPENNLGEPDCLYHGLPIEIKGRRLDTSSMITLFTLEPETRHLKDADLIRKYGYRNSRGRPALKVTLTPASFTPQGLKLEIDKEVGSIAIVDRGGYKPWVWTTDDINIKLRNLCVIIARTKKENAREYFMIESADLATELDTTCFFDLVAKGLVKIDLRMHLKPSGVARNHGTAFRLSSYSHLLGCYRDVKRIL